MTVNEAARALLDAVPPYAGLAVYVNADERRAFHAAEWRVVQACDALREALDGEDPS